MEEKVWEGSPSQKKNTGIFIACGLTFWLVVPIFIGFWKWLYTRSQRYDVTSERLCITSGIFSKRTEELELYRVRDITLIEPFSLRMFSLGNIELWTTDRSTPRLTLEAIPMAYQLKEVIRKNVEKRRDQKRVRQVDYSA